MALIALRCPSCNGDIQLDDNHEFGFCMYCGCKVALQEKISQQVSIDETPRVKSLLMTAEGYYKQGYDTEAYEYARRAVDLDASSVKGWYLVAKTSSRLSEKKVAYCRVMESADNDPIVDECRGEYSCLKNKVSVRVIADLWNNYCTLYVDKGPGYSIFPGTDFEIVMDKGIHRFRFNWIASNNPFGVKREITKDCKAYVRWNTAAVIDFERSPPMTFSKSTICDCKMWSSSGFACFRRCIGLPSSKYTFRKPISMNLSTSQMSLSSTGLPLRYLRYVRSSSLHWSIVAIPQPRG